VFSDTEFYKQMTRNSLNLPPPAPLINGRTALPYFFVGDEAFPMSENLMKVYPGYHPKGSKERIFNYRLSRARRLVENVFGIASSIFRVLRKPLLLEPEKAQLVVMTVTLLHNFLGRRPESAQIYTPPGTFDSEEDGVLTDGAWRRTVGDMNSLLPMRKVGRKTKSSVKDVRAELADFFFKEGKVVWQDEYA